MSNKSTSLDAHFLDVSINTPEQAIPHNLGRVPLEGFVLRNRQGVVVFRGPTAWTAEDIFLQASGLTRVRLLIF